MRKNIIIPLILLTFNLSAQKYDWKDSDKKEFMDECNKSIIEESMNELLTNEELKNLCDCALYEIQDKVKDKSDADKLSDEVAGEIIFSCLPKGWPEKITNLLINECSSSGAPEDFCICYIDNLKNEFPDFWEFSRLSSEDKISEETNNKIIAPCIK